MNFGCFVQLEGLKKKWEGLVHVSQVCCFVFLRESIFMNEILTEIVLRYFVFCGFCADVYFTT